MNNGNKIEQILKNSSVLEKIVRKTDEQRAVKNPQRNDEKFFAYCDAVALLKEFLPKNNRGKARFDNPFDPFDYHTIAIMFDNDEFDKMEIKEFIGIIELFDSMMFSGSSNGNITLYLMMENIYY